ncbi:KTSC domain-containing protein [Kitasatospora sp. NPDC059571]|uniref:KTSC domain-containing protein n=1 Tax=Kitasatospora sp. NPDC059571 TaxID=3346871 RepID=UPI003677C97B
MEREPVDSTCLRSVGHDAGRRVLEVEFVGGTVYHYFGVPGAVVARLLAAPSLGRYFNREIKPRYRYRRISPSRPARPWPPSSPPV